MPKYLIEGAIDFYSELYKSLDEDENNFKTEEDNNLCLITKQPLTTNYVTMECGHKFNYVPLFKDIDNHKRNFNNMEGNSGRLGKNEIRCPYCRKKQTTLLPYYENIGVPKVIGVNQTYFPPTYNETKINNTHWGPCEYLDHSTQFGIFQDASGIIQEGSINTKVKCNCHGSPICINTYGTNYGDTKKYCYTHKRMMIRKYKKEMLDKAKADAKMVIQKAKEDAKKAKEEAKLKAKEETKKHKLEEKENAKKQPKKQKKITENVVLGPSDVVISNNGTAPGCISILKSGINKGNPCGCTIIDEESKLCKRHYSNKNTKQDE